MRVVLVLLAAGDSRRFQGNKLLSTFQGKLMYRHIAEQVASLPGDLFYRKILVTQYPEIAADLGRAGYEVIDNKNSSMGISHSIHLALEAMDGNEDAVCFAVCDQPWLRGETIASLLKNWEASGMGLACLSHKGDFGNPAVFAGRYRPELLALTGDVGGKRVLRKHLDDLYLYETADGEELVDIDVSPL